MKSTIAITLIFALGASAGIFTLNWGPVEGDFTELEIRSKGVLIQTIVPEDGVFPEGEDLTESYYVIADGCIGCGLCVSECPVDAITMTDDGIAYIDPELCINCGLCASACPTGTIETLDGVECELYGIDADGEEELLQEGFEVE